MGDQLEKHRGGRNDSVTEQMWGRVRKGTSRKLTLTVNPAPGRDLDLQHLHMNQKDYNGPCAPGLFLSLLFFINFLIEVDHCIQKSAQICENTA